MKAETKEAVWLEQIRQNSAMAGLLGVVLSLAAMSASAAVRYVDVNSTNAKWPYTNWDSAAI